MNREALRKYRCRNGAEGIIGKLSIYSAEQIIIASFFHTENHKALEMMKRYEKMIVLAKVNPSRYIQERDRLHLDLAGYIHEHKLYREWFDFIYVVMTHMRENLILDAYKSEAMETWNYLTNYEPINIYGLTSDNQLLIEKEVYGDWDIEMMRLRKLQELGKISMERFQELVVKENEKNNLFAIERHENMIDIAIFETMPFINERTKAIMPKQWLEMGYSGNIELPRDSNNPMLPRVWKSTEFYREQVKKRKYMINKKGCKAFLKNAGNLTEVFFMEDVTPDKKIVMLYRVSTRNGAFIGFYHLGDEYFFSPYRGSSERSIHDDLENLVMELYAEIVCGLEKDRKRLYALKEVDNIDEIDDFKSTHVYVQFGLYHEKSDHDEAQGRRGFTQRIHERGKAIRKLREGQHVSEEAIERAREYGIEIQEGYTFVRPYTAGGIKEIRKEIKEGK